MKFIGIRILNPLKTSGGQPIAFVGFGIWLEGCFLSWILIVDPWVLTPEIQVAAASGIWTVRKPQTTQSHKLVQFKQTWTGSRMVNGRKRWVMHQGFVHLEAERPAAELYWSPWSFWFLVNSAPLPLPSIYTCVPPIWVSMFMDWYFLVSKCEGVPSSLPFSLDQEFPSQGFPIIHLQSKISSDIHTPTTNILLFVSGKKRDSYHATKHPAGCLFKKSHLRLAFNLTLLIDAFVTKGLVKLPEDASGKQNPWELGCWVFQNLQGKIFQSMAFGFLFGFFYGLYHGKSPLNHHLGEYLLFPNISSKSDNVKARIAIAKQSFPFVEESWKSSRHIFRSINLWPVTGDDQKMLQQWLFLGVWCLLHFFQLYPPLIQVRSDQFTLVVYFFIDDKLYPVLWGLFHKPCEIHHHITTHDKIWGWSS